MKKTIILVSVFALVFSLVLSASIVNAKPSGFALPSQASEVADNIFSLGSAYDVQSGSMVEGYAIVHKKSGKAKSANAKPAKGQTCYGAMAAGAKWKTVENWEAFGGDGLSTSFVLDRVAHSISTWESAASANILGNGSTGSGPIVDPFTLDNENQVSFGPLDNGTIAVTVVWGNFGGPTFNRNLVAWDQIYNTEDITWTTDAAVETDEMDFWNIAMHELGHSMGLKDIYTNSCSEVTMYGYGTEGETKKRSLAPADITGINSLY